MADDRVKLVPLSVYHGKPGKGLSIQMSVRQGPVTVLSVVEGKAGFSLLVAEGQSVAGPTMQIGNTNSRYKFAVSVKSFIEQWSKAGPSHHCAIGIGHIADKIQKLGFLLDIPVKQI
jgi:L-arabinose isomerase